MTLPREILAFSMSFAAAATLSPALGALARKLGFVSRPRADRFGEGQVPYLGGFAVAAAFGAAALVFTEGGATAMAVIASSLVMLLVGLLDDLKDLKPHAKLLGATLAGVMAYSGGVYVDVLYPWGSLALTVAWFAVVTTAFNLLDNMDALAPGIAVICAFILVIDTRADYADPDVGLLAAALMGAAGGFLIWNFPPARIYLGDAGSLFTGSVLAAISISGTWKDASNLAVTMALPVFLLSVPIFDAVFVSVSRRREGRPISRGGTDHVSHRLVKMGLSRRGAVLVLWLSGLVLGLGAFYMKRSVETLAVMMVATIAAMAVSGWLLYRKT